MPLKKMLSTGRANFYALSKITEFETNEGDENYALVDTESDSTIDVKKHIKAYEVARTNALTELFDRREDYLILNEKDKLMKYSPKYNTILNKINETKAPR